MPLDELSIIDRFFRPLAGEGAFGLRDDAALIDVPPDRDLVVTTDMVAENVHFLPGDPPETIAQKALRVNISDLVAKGAKPTAYVLSLGLSRDIDETWLTGFAAGLAGDQWQYGISLLGGDTISVVGTAVISVTAFGFAPKGRMVHRFGGKPGDELFVSGTIGACAVGLALRTGEAGPWDHLPRDSRDALVHRYRVPVPPIALSPPIADFASAAMDISDGLVGDCDKLAAASGCSAVIDAGAVPLPPMLGAKGDEALLARLLTAGEDYEVLAAVPPERAETFRKAAEASAVPVARIGELVAGSAPTEVLFSGRPLRLTRRAYVHGQSEEG